MASLRALDSALNVRWNVITDRYVITETRRDTENITVTVQAADGGFRRLDGRVIADLREWDAQKYGGMKHRIREMNEENERIKRQQNEQFRDTGRQATKEAYHQIKGDPMVSKPV